MSCTLPPTSHQVNVSSVAGAFGKKKDAAPVQEVVEALPEVEESAPATTTLGKLAESLSLPRQAQEIDSTEVIVPVEDNVRMRGLAASLVAGMSRRESL